MCELAFRVHGWGSACACVERMRMVWLAGFTRGYRELSGLGSEAESDLLGWEGAEVGAVVEGFHMLVD